MLDKPECADKPIWTMLYDRRGTIRTTDDPVCFTGIESFINSSIEYKWENGDYYLT